MTNKQRLEEIEAGVSDASSARLYKNSLWLISRVKTFTAALEKCDPSLHPVFVCNEIRRKALSETAEGES